MTRDCSSMAHPHPTLHANSIRLMVQSPCTMDWDQMKGNAKQRYCKKCSQQVYNFSEMSSDEVESLINRDDQRVCAQFYCRDDGTIIMKDCPRAPIKRISRWQFSIASVLGIAVALAFLDRLGNQSPPPPPPPPVPAMAERMMGKIACPAHGQRNSPSKTPSRVP